MAGPSGAGYTYPSGWPVGKLPTFTRMTARYMRATGLDSAVILNRAGGRDVPLAGAAASRYLGDVRPLGLLEGWVDHTGTSVLGGSTPVSVSYLTSSVTGAKAAIARASAGWTGTAPLFLSIGILAWNMTPTDVAAVAAGLDDRYQVVRGDQYFRLARQALKLPAR